MGRYRLPHGTKHKRDAAEDTSSGWWIILPVIVVAVTMSAAMLIFNNSLTHTSGYQYRRPHLPTNNRSDRTVDSLIVDSTQQDSPNTATAKPTTKHDAQDFSLTPTRDFYIAAVGRSPLPEYDEKLDRPISPIRLDQNTISLAPELKPGQILPWHQAPQYLGRIATIQGEVLLARNTGKVCFLNFVKQWRGRFYIILFEDVLDSWPQPPEKYFLHKTVRVTGKITTHDTVSQIHVRDPSQITIINTQ